jgi:hypothetical protein
MGLFGNEEVEAEASRKKLEWDECKGSGGGWK